MSQSTAPRASRRGIAEVLDGLLLWARRAAPTQMSSTSLTTLDTLAVAGPLRITDLARGEGVTQPTMTTLVARLCDEGYAVRVPHPQDRRSMLVDITDAGRQALADRHAQRTAALESAIAGLPVVHQDALADVADSLSALTHVTRTGRDTTSATPGAMPARATTPGATAAAAAARAAPEAGPAPAAKTARDVPTQHTHQTREGSTS